MRHFIVSTSYWRGVSDPANHKRRIKRACDWKDIDVSENQGKKCDNCQSYVDSLRRQGVRTFQ